MTCTPCARLPLPDPNAPRYRGNDPFVADMAEEIRSNFRRIWRQMAGPNDWGIVRMWNKWLDLNPASPGALNGKDLALSEDDFRGRRCYIHAQVFWGSPEAALLAPWSSSASLTAWHQAFHSSNFVLGPDWTGTWNVTGGSYSYNGTALYVWVDGTDGGKLKLHITTLASRLQMRLSPYRGEDYTMREPTDVFT